MAKKLNEKELNNVSGGCGGDSNSKFYYTLTCYDSNNVQIGPKTESAHFKDVKDQFKIRNEAIEKLLNSNPNIYLIIYVFSGDGKEGRHHRNGPPKY